MIPPALVEIGQPVAKGNLNQLEGGAGNPGHLRVSNHHHFEPPSCQVGHKVHVKHRLVNVVHARHRVLGREDAAVFRIVSLGQRVAERRVEKFECLSCLVTGQQQNEGHERGVAQEDAEQGNEAPARRRSGSSLW